MGGVGLSENEKRAFRNALGEFATGVTVVTTKTSMGERVGITVSSFNSVSLEPPLVLFSVASSAFSGPHFRAARSFAVNVLHAGQTEISARFSRSVDKKWLGIDWGEGSNGMPVASDALAIFECNTHTHFEGGNHKMILGLVTNFTTQAERSPLIFYRGRYHRLAEIKAYA